ncbi:bifunctional DNA-formamidopyrimidine glycosylase/DNA-(apurinic or apyrimidinic site) lyase [Oceanicella actignis]|uniref:Formamidopyrimidine-DNA glycosylase n=1 Tax=Oceanicella actignis TaxID=1189325 RepID=A0A1M7SU55_9RHOB|nr:bifunctional DNA-formamidopyrimidine glycosylase/DNA-(apurinic or apyrimidinic site) lyase [Oceanicella actignis]SES70593.1 DNA-(apurinic or apyrimidinic site) lyase [Oceanicella actignis]SHN61930.1 DNA-(apurinic or apyrimidinic site) lyase [Oceanicella actignis]
MPELPEVETVRRGLAPAMEGRRIARARQMRPDLRRPFPPDFELRVSGTRVLRLRRRGKCLLLDLDSGQTLLIHLGMSGRMLIEDAAPGAFHHQRAAPRRHDHVVFEMEHGARIAFNDARRFGAMDLLPTDRAESLPPLAGLGPEPLDDSFDAAALRARLAGRRTPIKTALMDQRVVAGLGNIYASEALWRAGIAPSRPAGRIGAARVERLTQAIRDTLREAIAAGGSSLRDHRQANGELGYFQHAFAVYGREGLPCLRPGCAGTIRRTVQGGRSSFHCPACQR